jgi:hypothetical protein
MSTLAQAIKVAISGHVKVIDENTKQVLLDKHNAIHPQNMARVIARALSNEPNSNIFRIAFGNGGTFIDAGGNIVFRQPNDGSNGAGWEARLYRETYSEIVETGNASFGVDPGSAGPDNVRVGGGSNPAGDPSGGGVSSAEVGSSSNIVISMVINEAEPSGQLLTQSSPSPTLEADEDTFIFDEIGLYTSGLPAVDTAGVASIDIGNKISTDDISPALSGSTDYALRIEVDGVVQDAIITTPLAGTGTGTAGAFTYGDLCEGINSGAWISSGFDFSSASGAFFFVTDRSGGTYPTISGLESYGFLTVQSKTTGLTSEIIFPEDNPIGGDTNLVYALASFIWANANVNSSAGQAAGVINDSVTPDNERERLLSHLIFTPILKSQASVIRVVYTLTVSVASTEDSDSSVTVNQ